MAIIAIHQPNYMPWLGYFHKIAKSDVFVFLDDVQYSKNSYINRVRVLHQGSSKWLTVPASYRFGDSINQVLPARSDWRTWHLNTLSDYYRPAACFRAVWPRIVALYDGLTATDLAGINRSLVEGIAAELGISCRYEVSSDFSMDGLTSDDRLAALVNAVDQKGTYLSGRGGASYQDAETFKAAGLGLEYADFKHPRYDQGDTEFIEGLSVLDPVFRLGWTGAAALISEANQA